MKEDEELGGCKGDTCTYDFWYQLGEAELPSETPAFDEAKDMWEDVHSDPGTPKQSISKMLNK